LQGALGGTNDAFVSKLSAAGGTLTYSTFLGGSGGEYGQGIAIDNAGGALVVGQTGSSNFPTLSAAQAVFGGSASDAFVSRLNPSGSAFVYSTYLGGTAPDVATGVAQVGGSAIVVGYTSSTNFPQLGASQPTLAGDSDAFLTRLSQTGSSFDYSTYLGGSGSDVGNAVLVDNAGYVYVTGQTSSSDFPIVSAIAGQESLSGSSDAFLVAFSASAGTKAYATYLGGNAADAGVSIAAGASLLHVLGNTFSTNFPTQAPLFSAPLGPQDGFVARLPLLTLTPAPAGAWASWLSLGTLLLGVGLVVLSSRQRFASAVR
jgi:Beta-propeller repeat